MQLVAPVRETPAVKVDAYGQSGELFQYPYPLDEQHYLVAWHPAGWAWAGPHGPRFALYWMASDGRREQLVADRLLPCGQAIPLLPRPAAVRPVQVDYRRSDATCYVQNVYAGPGLSGFPAAPSSGCGWYRSTSAPRGSAPTAASGRAEPPLSSTPISIGNGAWDPKTILGDATVYDDGSALFHVPARTPLYFQLLDERGRMVQSMRSWTTLQPGENAACVGCHEQQESHACAAVGAERSRRRGAEALRPFGPRRRDSASLARSSRSSTGSASLATTAIRRSCRISAPAQIADPGAKRAWSEAYLALTHADKRAGRRERRGPGAAMPITPW